MDNWLTWIIGPIPGMRGISNTLLYSVLSQEIDKKLNMEYSFL